MSDINRELYSKAEAAIEELFSDTSVSLQQAIENLEELKGTIDMYISALEEDMEVQDEW